MILRVKQAINFWGKKTNWSVTVLKTLLSIGFFFFHKFRHSWFSFCWCILCVFGYFLTTHHVKKNANIQHCSVFHFSVCIRVYLTLCEKFFLLIFYLTCLEEKSTNCNRFVICCFRHKCFFNKVFEFNWIEKRDFNIGQTFSTQDRFCSF